MTSSANTDSSCERRIRPRRTQVQDTTVSSGLVQFQPPALNRMKVQHRFNVDGNASASATATATAAANATAAASAVAANPFDPNKNHNHCHTSTFFNHHESASSYCPRVVSCDSSLEHQEHSNSNHLTPRPSSTLTFLNLTSPPERNFPGAAGSRGPITKYTPVTNIGANTSVWYKYKIHTTIHASNTNV